MFKLKVLGASGNDNKKINIPEKSVFIELFGGSFIFRGTAVGLKVTVKPVAVLKAINFSAIIMNKIKVNE